MGLTTEAQELIAEAFNTDLSDAVKSFTLNQYQRGQYDPSTGSLTGAAFPNSYTSRGVFDSYSQPEILNSAVEPADVKLIVLKNEIGTPPKIGDQVVEALTSKIYRVIHVEQDPADVIWELQIRSTE